MDDHTAKRRPGGLFERISSVIFGSGGGEAIDAPASSGPGDAGGFGDSETIDAATLEEVREQLARGRKIEAIKAYREAASCELKDAKEAVERIALRDGLREAA